MPMPGASAASAPHSWPRATGSQGYVPGDRLTARRSGHARGGQHAKCTCTCTHAPWSLNAQGRCVESVPIALREASKAKTQKVSPLACAGRLSGVRGTVSGSGGVCGWAKPSHRFERMAKAGLGRSQPGTSCVRRPACSVPDSHWSSVPVAGCLQPLSSFCSSSRVVRCWGIFHWMQAWPGRTAGCDLTSARLHSKLHAHGQVTRARSGLHTGAFSSLAGACAH